MVGIEAPGDIPVHRQEVYEAIQRGEPQKQKGQEQRGRDATGSDASVADAA
jgi:sRNA-binding carbon storage regulator CsrA